MKLIRLIFPVAVILGLAGCQDPSFSIKGEVQGAEGKTLVLEKADNAGYWIALDSTSLKSNGKFSFSGHAPAAPEIYRLALGDQYIYFPVDSLDNLTLKASAGAFATDFTLEGSENAVNMGVFEKQLIAASPYLSIPDSAAAFKRRVYARYLQNAKGSVVSYYILTKTVNDKPLFDPAEDARYFAAVATSFKQFRPGDPRCQLLENIATQGLRRKAEQSGRRRVVEAEELGYFPISLPDESGKDVALSDLAGKGIPVVLVFEDLANPDNVALNADLQKLSESGRAKVYSVGLDADQLVWRNAAKNYTFTTVYANVTNAQEICLKYQISDLPTLFVIDSAGSITGRSSDFDSLRL
ncbi:MAG: DUF4369 domain-containing protein [Muribaculaceae bacterium]|nr:DUF4369 domain-containing protein [Muribaculaceae bacterium]